MQRMFDAIAPVYDRMNRLMAFGLDRGWRKTALKMLRRYHPRRILDVATGTGDLPFMMCRMLDAPSITGIDLSEGMLAIAREKCREQQLHDAVVFEKQDCLSLTFPDASFDAVTVAFGVRNFKRLSQGCRDVPGVETRGNIDGDRVVDPDTIPVCAGVPVLCPSGHTHVGAFVFERQAGIHLFAPFGRSRSAGRRDVVDIS